MNFHLAAYARQRNLSRGAIKKRGSEMILETLNAPGERRLLQLQNLGCSLKTAKVYDRKKNANVEHFAIHIHILRLTALSEQYKIGLRAAGSFIRRIAGQWRIDWTLGFRKISFEQNLSRVERKRMKYRKNFASIEAEAE